MMQCSECDSPLEKLGDYWHCTNLSCKNSDKAFMILLLKSLEFIVKKVSGCSHEGDVLVADLKKFTSDPR